MISLAAMVAVMTPPLSGAAPVSVSISETWNAALGAKADASIVNAVS